MSKITLIDQYGAIGGGQMVLIQLVDIFVSRGHQVTVLAPMGGELEEALRARHGNDINYANLTKLNLRQGQKGPIDYLKILLSPLLLLPHLPLLVKSSLVYVNGGRFFPAWGTLNKLIKIPSVYHIHLDHSRIEKKAIGLLARDPRNLIICVSDFISSRLPGKGLTDRPANNIKTINNALRRELSTTPFNFRFSRNVAVIGRLSKEKGQEILVSLAPLLPATTFYLLGSSDFADAAFEQNLRAQAPANLIFLGKVRNIREVFDRYRISFSLVPSRCAEAFGLAAIESMALSCVTMVSNCGELPNIAAKTGAILFTTESELAETLKLLASKSDEELLELAKNQYSRTVRQFTFSRFEKEIGEACDEHLLRWNSGTMSAPHLDTPAKRRS